MGADRDRRAAAPAAAPPQPGQPLDPGRPLPLPARVGLALVFILLALLATRQVGSLDIGFHLKAGTYVLEQHAWPRIDPFTYTLRDHPYIDTSWGYQVIVALVHRLSGAPGLVLFHAGLVLAVFGLLYRTARLRPVDPHLLTVLFLAGGLAAEMRFEARPELLSWLLLAAVVHILERRACGRSAPLWLLPIIHLAWGNMHGLFVLGWIAMAAYLLGTSRDGRWPDRALLRWTALALVAPIVNPYGWRGLLFPFTLATRLNAGNAFAQSIGEFVSPFDITVTDQFPFVPWAPLAGFWCFAALSALGVARAPAGRRLHAWLLWLPFMVLAAKMMRNLPLLVVATLPLAAAGLTFAGRAAAGRVAADRAEARRRGRARAGAGEGGRRAPGRIGLRVRRAALALSMVASIVIGLRVVTGAYYIATRRPERFGLAWNRIALPVDAARFAVDAGLGGPVLNHLNFGGYLMWALPVPVFIDGRLEVVGEEFYEAYRTALASPERLEPLAARYGVRWMIVPYAINARLLGQVSRDARWRLVHFDHLAAIFVRAGDAAGAPALPDPAADAPGAPVELTTLPGLGPTARPGAARRWLDGLLHRQVFPTEAYNRGLFHLFRNDLPRAAAAFAAATADSGGRYYETYNNLGAVLHRQGRADEARACYRVVLEDRPDHPIARQRAAAGP